MTLDRLCKFPDVSIEGILLIYKNLQYSSVHQCQVLWYSIYTNITLVTQACLLCNKIHLYRNITVVECLALPKVIESKHYYLFTADKTAALVNNQGSLCVDCYNSNRVLMSGFPLFDKLDHVCGGSTKPLELTTEAVQLVEILMDCGIVPVFAVCILRQ